MLTARGWWFLIIVFILLALGAFDEHSGTLALVALTLLLWFLGEWFLFALRVRLAVPGLVCRRALYDERGSAGTLWAGRAFQVHTELRLAHRLRLPYLCVQERIPSGARHVKGLCERQGALTAGAALALTYHLRCPAAGRLRFEGVGVQLADFQGFFYHVTFVPRVDIYRVLPPLADTEGHRPSVKRHNLLPSPGLHRHLRPGSGSELLDLRDYLPGDPPKTIAWKVSARRDRLITKEFESEVPVRCTLFVDTSPSVRIGVPGKNALARLVDVSAAVAQAAAGMRDLTGLCLFDDQVVTNYLRPARSTCHLITILHSLADAAGLPPTTGQARLATLLPLAYGCAQEVYPHLLRTGVNRVAGWLPWAWSLPAPPERRFPLFRWSVRALFLGLASLPLAAFVFLSVLLWYFFYPVWQVLLLVPELMLILVGCLLVISSGVLYCAFVNRVYRSFSLFFASRRRAQTRWRKQLAALLSIRSGLAPAGVGLLLEDDEALVAALQRFLAEHHIPYPLPLYDRRGQYLFTSPGKVEVLAQALLRAVGKGHDNELFVLLVDLLELTDELAPLLRAVKVSLARHHQVFVICPWPPGIPPPDSRQSLQHTAQTLPREDVQLLMREATAARLHHAYHRLRKTFARMGVPVVCAESGDPVRLILDRLNRLRALGLGGRR
jgi:uncharacterized protein (DUF58 family)